MPGQASGKTFDTPNPATGETLARVAEGDAEDINRAVRAARRAFEDGPWSRLTPSERGRLIWRIGDLILEHVDELAQLESLDNGKPYAVAKGADVPLAADLFHYMAGWATKKVTLELGGKSPNIVFDDADEGAVEGAANAIFFNHGQCCVAGSRLFVQQSRFDEVVDGVSEIAKSIKLGSGMDESTQMGPLVSDEQFRRVTGYLESGQADGATAVTGGGRFGDRGYFVGPTVITNTRPDMKIVREEIFGPVVVAAPFQSLDEIAAVANDTEYGLGAGIWTRDISKAHALAKKIRAGTVWINCYNVFDASLPFGGYKQSGWGREMGHQVLEAYTEVKAVTTQL